MYKTKKASLRQGPNSADHVSSRYAKFGYFSAPLVQRSNFMQIFVMPVLGITSTNDMWLNLTLLLSMHRNIDPISIKRSIHPQLDGE